MTQVTIDFVSRDPSTNTYRVFLVDTEPWHGDTRLASTAERLQAAINWMAEGGLEAQFPAAKGAPAMLVFEYLHEPDEQGHDLLSHAQLAAAGVGIEVVVRPQPT